jgi:hypothetical protein
MTDVDEALRADAQRWRAAQATDLDLDGLFNISMLTRPRHRRRSAIIVAAAAVVVATAGLGLAVNRSHNHSPKGATTNHSVPSSSATSNKPPTPSSSAPARLPGLGSPPPGQRTLLKTSGTTDDTSTIAQSTGRGELYAACIGGGTIKIHMPGSGGFDLDCTGMASGASIPKLSTTVRVTHVHNQTWRVAVFGH